MFGGLLLLAAALSLTIYNFWDEQRAGDSAQAVLNQFDKKTEEGSSALFPGVWCENMFGIPDYILNPEMAMPTVNINGREYIGTLSVPSLGLELPVLSSLSYTGLRIAPCRYVGSAYQDNLVIAAHNYRSHFGLLKTLCPGNEVIFTDVDGHVFRYVVVDTEILKPTAVAEMVSGDWKLTLFTCTLGGQNRVTVRCR